MVKNKLTKILMVSVALWMTTSVFAIPKGPRPKDKSQSRIDRVKDSPTPGPFAFVYPKDLKLSSPNDFYFAGEFLLVQVKEEGLDYGITQNNVAAGTGNSNVFPLTGGDIQGYSTGHHSWNWNYGCRLGCGFYLNHDAWTVDAQWTYIRFKNDSGKNLNGGVILSLFLPPDIQLRGASNISSSARWTGNLNTLDLSLGKPYHISRFLVFHPFFGVRIAWIDQDYTTRPGGDYFDGTDEDNSLESDSKNDFCGIGTRAGLKTEWDVGAGFSLLGNLAASFLVSHFDIHQSLQFANVTRYEIKNDFYTNKPNAELALGINWGKNFSKDRYRVALRALYEFHCWWDQNHLRRFFSATPSANDEVARGDLTINGFSFAIQFDF